VEKGDRLLAQRGLLLLLTGGVLGGYVLVRLQGVLKDVAGEFFGRDALFGIRDDRFFQDGDFGRSLLGLGFVYFCGIVGLRGIRKHRLCWRGGRVTPKMACVSVLWILYTLLDVVDLIAGLLFVESDVNCGLDCATSGDGEC
jgi:hypothetical protein